jgi:tetratricopeptide (TPR) repeat protein
MFSKQKYVYGTILLLVTIGLYSKAVNNQFINYDDPIYITENLHVLAGITWSGLKWAFASSHDANWFPLTWLSHMLDVQMFGADPGRHHLVSVLIHSINALLLFAVINRATQKTLQSVLVAGLFALHPLHVESVAWSAERKDLLSTFFMMMALYSYLRYIEKTTIGRYVIIVLMFICGLMSKSMIVTMPCLMILLDYWPLGRIRSAYSLSVIDDSGQMSLWGSFLEKLPLFLLSLISSVVTFQVQNSGGAVAKVEYHTFLANVANALLSYTVYIQKMLWPVDLAIFYPHPGKSVMNWEVMVAILLLSTITVAAIWLRRIYPYLLVGWLWYLGMLFPVIGLIQVGSQAMADRYTYLPITGLFILFIWGVSDIASYLHTPKGVQLSAAVIVLLVLSFLTWKQLDYWQNSIKLFQHTIAVTNNNALAHNMLGAALTGNKQVFEAVPHYQEAIRINPQFVKAQYNLGLAYILLGRIDEAIEQYRLTIALLPEDADAHNNLGLAYARKGMYGQAIIEYQTILNRDPNNVIARNNLGVALKEIGDIDRALEQFAIALQLKPDHPDIHYYYGLTCEKKGWHDKAIEQFKLVLRIQPDDAIAHNALGTVLLKTGQIESAVTEFQIAVRLNPNLAEFSSNLRKAQDSLVNK